MFLFFSSKRVSFFRVFWEAEENWKQVPPVTTTSTHHLCGFHHMNMTDHNEHVKGMICDDQKELMKRMLKPRVQTGTKTQRKTSRFTLFYNHETRGCDRSDRYPKLECQKMSYERRCCRVPYSPQCANMGTMSWHLHNISSPQRLSLIPMLVSVGVP